MVGAEQDTLVDHQSGAGGETWRKQQSLDSLGKCWSFWWSVAPVFAGLWVLWVGRSKESVEVLRMREFDPRAAQWALVVVGLCSLFSVIPTFGISMVAASPEFMEMLNETDEKSKIFHHDKADLPWWCPSEALYRRAFRAELPNRDFRQKLIDEMEGLRWSAIRWGVLWIVFYSATPWFLWGNIKAMLVCAAMGVNRMNGLAHSGFAGILLRMSNRDVDNFILEMIWRPEWERKGEGFLTETPMDTKFFKNLPKRDWQGISAKLFALDLRLEAMWRLAGMVLAPAIAIRITIGCTLAVLGIFAFDTMPKILLWGFAAQALIKAVKEMLFDEATLTNRCNSTSPHIGMSHIRAVVNSFTVHGGLMDEGEEQHHIRFLHYLNSTTSGVNLCGILVDQAFVSRLIVTLATNLPLALAMMQTLVNTNLDMAHLDMAHLDMRRSTDQ